MSTYLCVHVNLLLQSDIHSKQSMIQLGIQHRRDRFVHAETVWMLLSLDPCLRIIGSKFCLRCLQSWCYCAWTKSKVWKSGPWQKTVATIFWSLIHVIVKTIWCLRGFILAAKVPSSTSIRLWELTIQSIVATRRRHPVHVLEKETIYGENNFEKLKNKIGRSGVRYWPCMLQKFIWTLCDVFEYIIIFTIY